MNILRRGVPAGDEASQNNTPEATVTRRIEVTVERETVTMLVRAHPVKTPDAPPQVTAGPESELSELPAGE